MMQTVLRSLVATLTIILVLASTAFALSEEEERQALCKEPEIRAALERVPQLDRAADEILEALKTKPRDKGLIEQYQKRINEADALLERMFKRLDQMQKSGRLEHDNLFRRDWVRKGLYHCN